MLLLVLVAFGLRALWLDHASLTVDEGMSWLVSLHWREAAQWDIHPPLYSLLLHGWWLTGHTDGWLRLSSVLAGCLCVPASFWMLGQAGWERSQRWLPCWALACSTYAVEYSRELRMYPLLSLEFVLGFGCLLGLRRQPSRKLWMGYLLCALAAGWTHYFGLFLLLLAPAVLPRRRLGLWALVCLGVVASLVPWLRAVAGLAGQHDFSLRPLPSLLELPELIGRILFGDLGPVGNPIFMALGGLALLVLVWRARTAPGWLWAWAGLPVLLVWLESRWGPTPVFEFKYFLWCLPAWIGLLVWARLPRPLWWLWLLLNLSGQAWLQQPINFGQDWRRVAAFLHGSRDLVLVEPSMMSAPLLFYGLEPQAIHPVDSVAEVEALLRGQTHCLLVSTPYHPAAQRANLAGFLQVGGALTTVWDERRSQPSAVVRVQSWQLAPGRSAGQP